MNRFTRFLKEKRNKILAILFASLAMAAFLCYYLVEELVSSWHFFRSNPLEIWSFAIALITYGLLLICNIRNDSFAYQGILMFVFYTALGAFFDLVQGMVNAFLGPLLILFLSGKLIIGVFLYLNTTRYMRGYSVPWRRIRIFGIVYAALLTLSWAVYAGLALLFGGISLMAFLTLSFSEALIGWCIVFTLERLRRY
ncbi:MAG: hypothetical protein J5736_04580 [Bacilli bacterium]|nr:hypothetical protein [Bacilli bacterium]